LFRRRVKILLWAVALAWLVLLARLAQIQIGSHDLFVLDNYTRAGGNRLLETVRGGIYARWGTPLAVQAPSFDIAVHYRQLLPACSEPWRLQEVRELIDEYAAAAGLPVPDEEACRRLWDERRTQTHPWGPLDRYVRRRLGGESERGILAGNPPPRMVDDWRPLVAGLTGRTAAELTDKADAIVRRVQRMEARVRRRQMEREGKADIRITERYQWHVVAEDVPARVAAVLRTEPERFPALRVGRREEPAIKVLERTARRYPNGDLAAHVVGRVAPVTPEIWDSLLERGLTWTAGQPYSQAGKRYRMDDRLGVLGVEKAAEDLLRGRRGHVLNRLVFKFLTYERESQDVPPEAGHDVYLTLREDFQAAANAALRWAADPEMNPGLDFTAGALVIVDVRSGAVLAAATWPTYDLAEYRSRFKELNADPRTPLLFRPTQGALPTGSVYKVITAIAALEEGAITPSTTFNCRRREVFRAGRQSRAFTCTGLHGSISLVPAIQKSCNIYFYHAGLKVGGEALARWGRAFGLGVPTGVDLPYEARHSQVPEPKHTYGVINLSIGQGDMQCTPLQVADMMAAIANGGRLYRPHFIDHVRTADGEQVRATEPEFVQIDLKPGTLDAVREGMRLVVESGTARPEVLMGAGGLGLDRFRAAGKTGTAELGSGLPNHAWFAGYAPHDSPRIAFAVVSERTSTHGGGGTAPIMERCLDRIWDAVEHMP